MVTSNVILLDSRDGQHRENLRRDGLTPLSGRDRGAAGRIALAFAAVAALAVLGSLPAARQESESGIERNALSSAAPQIVALPESPSGVPAR